MCLQAHTAPCWLCLLTAGIEGAANRYRTWSPTHHSSRRPSPQRPHPHFWAPARSPWWAASTPPRWTAAASSTSSVSMATLRRCVWRHIYLFLQPKYNRANLVCVRLYKTKQLTVRETVWALNILLNKAINKNPKLSKSLGSDGLILVLKQDIIPFLLVTWIRCFSVRLPLETS